MTVRRFGSRDRAQAPVPCPKPIRSVTPALYPERQFASFSRGEGRFLFYSLIADLMPENAVVLDLGAGRGAQIDNSKGYMRQLMDLSSRCKRFIGIDPDPIVLTNTFLHEAHVMAPGDPIPVDDASVDVVISYAVLEHIDDPARIASEIKRILKPGGWFCAWTPNKFGYVGLAARLIPNRFHARFANLAEPRDRRQASDVFPVRYRMNTRSAISKAFGEAEFDDFSFYYNGSPSYHFNRLSIARFWILVMAILPMPLAKSLFVFIRKR